MKAIYSVGTDRKLPQEERTKQRQWIENNGLEWSARFADKSDAQRFVDKIESATKVRLVIETVYPVTMKVF